MKTIRNILGWVGSFGIAFVLAFLIGIFVVQPYQVSGSSMEPTLTDKERIYVSKLSHTFSYLPGYGDIVIVDSRVERKRSWTDEIMENPLSQLFYSNNDEHTFLVKRVIGRPGDTIEIKDQSLYRNGEKLEEPYIKETMNISSSMKWIVPENHIFVMGDNRNHSLDSREIGFIPLDHVMGKKF